MAFNITEFVIANLYTLLALVIFLIYGIGIYILYKKKILEKYNMSLYGPFIMWRTQKGRDLIDKLSKPKRFWRIYGNVAIVVCAVVMFVMFALLLWQAIYIKSIPPESAPTPQMMIGLPIINPLIPWYGIIGLIVAMIVHEFAHGILSRVADIKIKSLGIVFCVIPLGAFVEPDEEGINAAGKIKRCRMLASGALTNIVVSLIFVIFFSWSLFGSVAPVQDGILVRSVISDHPAEKAGIHEGAIILSINNTKTDSLNNFYAALDSINASYINSTNSSVPVEIYYKGNVSVVNVTPADKYQYYQKYYPTSNKEEYKGKAYFGVTISDPEILSSTLSKPIRSANTTQGAMGNLLFYIGAPLSGMLPFGSPLTDAYSIHGFWSFLPNDAFWILTNIVYYVFWINIILGFSNVLPAIPFDGGHIFKDFVDTFISRIKRNLPKEKKEVYVRQIVYTVSLIVLMLILWQIIGPRLRF
ncbi:MAG: site-2 protease family protein [Thermoplasmata archaeon]